MPTFSRKSLRQNLGLNHLNDVVLGNAASFGGPLVQVIDSLLINGDASGQNLNGGAYLRVASGDYRVGSFNAPSGILASAQVLKNAVPSGADYEMSNLLPATVKDRAIDDVIKRLRVRQEVGFPSVDGALFYDIDGAASPAAIINPEDILDAYYYADPTNSLNRRRQELDNWDPQMTGSGMELRIAPRLSGSFQIVMDVLITLTLGASDAATVNIPDERLVLFGAESQCWHVLTKTAPGTLRATYTENRDDAARMYSDLAAKFKRPVARNLHFDRVVGPGFPSDEWSF